MAVTTIGPGDLSKGGAIVETSGGVKYAIFAESPTKLVVYKDIDAASTESTYYFDCSDGGPTDPGGVWTDDPDAFDGNEANFAFGVSPTVLNDYLGGEGTNAPAADGTIIKVETRIRCRTSIVGRSIGWHIRTDGWVTQLHTAAIQPGTSVVWSSYYELSVPSGGWTWAEIQALEVRINGYAADYTCYAYEVELRVTHRAVADSDTATTIFGGGSIGSVDAALRSDGDIDIVCAGTDFAQARDISFAIFDTSAGTIGAWEQAAAYTDGSPTNPGCAISIDSNGKPRVLYVDDVKYHGGNVDQIKYTDKVGASWLTPELVCGVASVNYKHPCISVDSADDCHALYRKFVGTSYNLQIYRLRNATWGTEDQGLVSYAHDGLALAVDGTTSRIVTADGSGNIYEGTGVDTVTDTGYDAKDQDYVVSMALVGTGRYIFYIDTSDDVHIISNDGGGWTDEGAQQTGTFLYVIAEWAYNNEHQSGEINYIFDDGTNVYYDSFSLEEGVTVQPNPASAIAGIVAPGVVLGSITYTPTARSAVGASLDPTVVLGSMTITPTAGAAVAGKADPAVIHGSLTLEPTPAASLGAVVAPVVILGSTTATPGAASAIGEKLDPTVVLGSITLTPTAVSAIGAVVDPTVLIPLVITPDAASAIAGMANPTVVLGSITLSPAAVDSIGAVVDPVVILGSIIFSPGAAAAIGAIVDPTVINDILLTPDPAGAIAGKADPTVVLGSLILTPGAAYAIGASVDPVVILGSVVVIALPAGAVAGILDPVVILGSLTIQPGVAAAIGGIADPTVTLGSVSATPVAASAIGAVVDPTVITEMVPITPAPASAVGTTVGPTVIIGVEAVRWLLKRLGWL